MSRLEPEKNQSKVFSVFCNCGTNSAMSLIGPELLLDSTETMLHNVFDSALEKVAQGIHVMIFIDEIVSMIYHLIMTIILYQYKLLDRMLLHLIELMHQTNQAEWWQAY